MYPNFKAELARRGLTLKDLSPRVDIRYETLCKKCRGDADFTIIEIYKILNFFKMTFEEIFKKDQGQAD